MQSGAKSMARLCVGPFANRLRQHDEAEESLSFDLVRFPSSSIASKSLRSTTGWVPFQSGSIPKD